MTSSSSANTPNISPAAFPMESSFFCLVSATSRRCKDLSSSTPQCWRFSERFSLSARWREIKPCLPITGRALSLLFRQGTQGLEDQVFEAAGRVFGQGAHGGGGV